MSNGKMKEQLEQTLPSVMQSNEQTVQVIKSLKEELTRPRNNADLSRYQTMEGMQNPDKKDFFTEYTNDDDVLRMNTIEAFTTVAPLIIRKTPKKNLDKIAMLMETVYIKHVSTHKINMTSKNRKREEAYVRILANDTTEESPSGFEKFFGVKRK